MQLMMYIGNDLIEAVSVDVAQLSIPGYLGGFKRQLKQKYQSLLQETAAPPEFLVINIAQTSNSNSSASSAFVATTQPVGVYCQ